jgi:hypothetical protein
MVAPGEDIATTGVDGGLVSGTGTSFAAPMVSGAAAVVKAAFPGVSGREVVDRLLTSATDLGAPGVDGTFGHGLLNMDRALDPNGPLSVGSAGTVGAPRQPVAGSQVVLGSAVTLDGNADALLAKAVAFDADNFPFAVDLRGSHRETGRSTGMAAFIAGADRVENVSQAGSSIVALAIDAAAASIAPYDPAPFVASDTSLRHRAATPSLQLQSAAGPGIDTFFAFNGSSQTSADLTARLSAEDGSLLAPGMFLAPFDALAGAQTGGGAHLALGADTTLTLAVFDAAESAPGDPQLRQAATQKVTLRHTTWHEVELRLGIGTVQEDGGFLGSQTAGAFGTDATSSSAYLDLSLLAPVSDRLTLFGAYVRGTSTVRSGAGSLLGEFSGLATESFGAGLLLDDVLATGDGFSLLIGQPLRVSDGAATMSVPIGRTEDGRVLHDQARVELAPAGREIATEAVYRFALDDAAHQSLAAGGFVRLNPDHDPTASPDLGIGLRYRWQF